MNRGTIEVSGPSPFCDIVVRDRDRQVVAAGTFIVRSELEPGIYQVAVWVPGAREERLVAVYESQHVTVRNFELVPDSVVPLSDIRTANGRHSELARDLAATPQHTIGPRPDGRLLLFTRTDGVPRFRTPDLVLANEGGAGLLQFATDGTVDLPNGCAGLSVDLPSGNYLLIQQVPGLGPRAQVLWVAPGRETQVFFPWQDHIADVGQAMICMPPLGTGFEPGAGERYYRVEAAIHRLVSGRHRATAEQDTDGDPVVALASAYTYASPRLTVTERARSISLLLDGLQGSADAWLLQALTETSGQAGRRTVRLSSAPLFAAGFDLLWDLSPGERAGLTDEWLAGAVSASTTGSVWARWDLDLYPLGVRLGDEQRHSLSSSLPVTPAPGTQSTRVSVRQLLPESVTLAASSSILVERGIGRHFDLGVWMLGDPPDHPPRAEIRVRVGVRIQAYLRQGQELWYGTDRVPRTPARPLELQIADGENLVANLELRLNLGEET